jgi:hypothetical protein
MASKRKNRVYKKIRLASLDKGSIYDKYADLIQISRAAFQKLIKNDIIPEPPKDENGSYLLNNHEYLVKVFSKIQVIKGEKNSRIMILDGPKVVGMKFYAQAMKVSLSSLYRWINEGLLTPPPKNNRGNIVLDDNYLAYLQGMITPLQLSEKQTDIEDPRVIMSKINVPKINTVVPDNNTTSTFIQKIQAEIEPDELKNKSKNIRMPLDSDTLK